MPMPLGASRAKPTIAVGFSIALKMATKCSRSISIQAFNSLLLQKNGKKGCNDTTILKTFCIFAPCDTINKATE